VLDEATSSLDSVTERDIQAALKAVCRNRTTVVIAHRLSTVRHADNIIVIGDGQIIEMGTHDELVAKQGTYAEMWKKQSVEDEQREEKEKEKEKQPAPPAAAPAAAVSSDDVKLAAASAAVDSATAVGEAKEAASDAREESK
jgi:ABC-type multidrug transport system ATPase subunit